MAPTMDVEKVPVSSLINGWEDHSFETKAATLGPLIAEVGMKLGKSDSYSNDEMLEDLGLMKRILTKFNEEVEKRKVDHNISELKRSGWHTRSLEILYDLSKIMKFRHGYVKKEEDRQWMIMMDLKNIDTDSLDYMIQKSKAQERNFGKLVPKARERYFEESVEKKERDSDIVHSMIKEYKALQEKIRCLADFTYVRDRPYRFVETSPAVFTFTGYKSRIEHLHEVLETKLSNSQKCRESPLVKRRKLDHVSNWVGVA